MGLTRLRQRRYGPCVRGGIMLAVAVLAACGGGSGSAGGEGMEPPPPPPPPSAGTLELDAASYEIDESTQTVTFTVVRTGGSAGAVSVDVTTADGTAFAGQDYGALTTTASFADGDTGSKSGTVIIFPDDEHEADETLTLSLENVTGGASIGPTASAVVTILDDDPASVSVGGTIEGLAGEGLVLRNNGGDDVPVGASEESFTFPTPLSEGESYAVSVAVQPWAPAQHCGVANGSGTAGTAGIADVVVTCTDVPLRSLLVSRNVGGQNDLLKMREDGSEFATLADTVDSETFAGFAGDVLLFSRHTADGADIYAVLPDGSGLTPLAVGPEPERFGGISADGSLVVFNRQVGVTAATDDVYVVGVDGLGERPLAATADDEQFAALATVAGEEWVVYSRTVSGQDDLHAVRLDGSVTVPLANGPEFERAVAIMAGGRVIFERSTATGGDLYSVLADGTGLVALTLDPADEELVRGLTDERLLYRREIEHLLPGEPSQYDLYAVNADGTEHVVIADTTVSEHFQGLTTGGRIVFSRELSDDRDLYAVDMDGTSMSTIAASGDYENFEGALPDGRIVFGRSDDAGGGDLFLVNPDGTGELRLTDTPELEDLSSEHFLAGERIVFMRELGSFEDVFSIRLDGTDERRLTDSPDLDDRVVGITESGGVLYETSGVDVLRLYRIGADGNGFAALGVSGEAVRLVTTWQEP